MGSRKFRGHIIDQSSPELCLSLEQIIALLTSDELAMLRRYIEKQVCCTNDTILEDQIKKAV